MKFLNLMNGQKTGRTTVNDKDCPFMPIEEMRKHEWTINWSGGKDSTATVIACIKYGVPIKEINYVRMMYDDELPATLPIMTDFVDECIGLFRDVYNIKINIIKSITCKEYVCDKIYVRSKYSELNGERYTLGYLSRGMCRFNACKVKALQSIKKAKYEMIGYAIDEPKRYKRLVHPHQESILCTLGITENKAFDICRRNNLLSPLYALGTKRDGCWFCPNCSSAEIDYIKNEHRELLDIIYEEFSCRNPNFLYVSKNSWISEYMKDRGAG